MACKEVTKEIDGKQCFCRQWNATKALTKKAELIQMGGIDIMPFVEGFADIKAMIALERKAKPDELVSLLKEFVCSIRVDGVEVQPAMFDMTYSGNLWLIVELFTFACEVQYKDFFEQGLTRLEDLR